MRFKSILGFCSCKGCRKRWVYNAELKVGEKKKKFKLCEEHTKEIMKLGKMKSVTYEETIDLD